MKLHSFARKWIHAVQGTIGIVGVVLTLGLWNTSCGSLRVMQHQLDAMRADQRAYVSVEKVSLKVSATNPRKVGATVFLTNKGKTPGRNVYVTGVGLTFGRAGRSDRAPDRTPQLAQPFHVPNVLPSAAVPFDIEVTDVPNDWNRSVFVVARIEYDDVAGCAHWLEVCRATDERSDPRDLGLCQRFGSEDMDSDLTCHQRK